MNCIKTLNDYSIIDLDDYNAKETLTQKSFWNDLTKLLIQNKKSKLIIENYILLYENLRLLSKHFEYNSIEILLMFESNKYTNIIVANFLKKEGLQSVYSLSSSQQISIFNSIEKSIAMQNEDSLFEFISILYADMLEYKKTINW